jgi:phosphate transport system substrate-binding protein
MGSSQKGSTVARIKALALLAAIGAFAAGALAQTGTAEKGSQPTGAVKVDPKIPVYKPAEGVSGTIKSIGSDTMNNVMAHWGDEFKKFYPGVKIEVEAKGSGTAPPALLEGQSQFGPMSRPMKASEIEAFKNKFGYEPTQLRTGIDTLAIFVDKDNPLNEITLEQAKKVFSVAGPAMTWGDLGVKDAKLAGQPIILYGRNSASGTYGYFKEHALGGADYKASVKEQPGSSAVVQAVGADPAGIGYSGIGYKTANVKMLKIKTAGGPAVEGTYATALSGEYPLARFLYVYVNKNPNQPLEPLRGEFIRMIFSRAGQEGMIKDGYFPVTPDIAAEELKKVGL